jgi:carbon-monoxide dehydrogenase small subunit
MPKVALTVNGLPVADEVEPRTSLADFVRRQNLTGTHLGCEHGVCGACTVLLDGEPARSCIAFAAALEGREIRTIEGFEDDRIMQALRQAFNLEHALQCGYCTPGMLITARDIVTRFADADEKRIRIELAGNLCRCTGYLGIVDAIRRVMRDIPAAERLAGRTPAANAAVRFKPPRPFTPLPEKTYAPQAAAPVFEPSALANGWSRVADHFIVDRPRRELWAVFADIPRVTLCMPGASFSEVSGPDVKGTLRVAFGPIKAEFACGASIERDDQNMRGVIRGAGGDARRGAQAKGQITYQLSEEPNGCTRVDVVVDYQLQGPFAQIARSGLVKDFARRLIAEFAANLAATLGGTAPTPSAPRSLSAGAVLWAAIRSRIARLWRRG